MPSPRTHRSTLVTVAVAATAALAACGGQTASKPRAAPSVTSAREALGDSSPTALAVSVRPSPEYDVTWSPSTGAETDVPVTSAPTVPSEEAAVRVVGVAHEAFVDGSRPTNAVEGVVDAAPTRSLPTIVWYPALGPPGADPGAAPVLDARPDVTGGPHPLIELSHGLTGHAADFEDLASVLVASGYVVVSPDFPETTGGTDPRAFPNFVHQPGDVVFTIDSMLALSLDPASRYHGLIDPDRIGIGGRSLGAATSLLTVYNSQFGEPRVRAVVSVAGAEFAVEGGAFEYDGKAPLLVVHGDADPTVGYAGSVAIYDHARAPKYFVTLKGQGHVNYFQAVDPAFAPFSSRVVAFYDHYVKGTGPGDLPLAHDDDLVQLVGQST